MRTLSLDWTPKLSRFSFNFLYGGMAKFFLTSPIQYQKLTLPHDRLNTPAACATASHFLRPKHALIVIASCGSFSFIAGNFRPPSIQPQARILAFLWRIPRRCPSPCESGRANGHRGIPGTTKENRNFDIAGTPSVYAARRG